MGAMLPLLPACHARWAMGDDGCHDNDTGIKMRVLIDRNKWVTKNFFSSLIQIPTISLYNWIYTMQLDTTHWIYYRCPRS